MRKKRQRKKQIMSICIMKHNEEYMFIKNSHRLFILGLFVVRYRLMGLIWIEVVSCLVHTKLNYNNS